MRWRTPLAGLAIIAGLLAYVVAVVTLAEAVPDNALVEAAYYVIAGLLWIKPAVAVIGWAKRDDGSAQG